MSLTGKVDKSAAVAFLTLIFLDTSNFDPVTEAGVSMRLRLQQFLKGQKESFCMTGCI